MIVVDSREDSQHPDIREFLEDAGVLVKVQMLQFGDFRVVGERGDILVERKGGTDLTRSLSSGALVDQLLGLTSAEGVKPCLLIEGSLAMLRRYTRWPDSSVVGWLVSVMERWNIQVVFLPSLYWTKLYLKALDKQVAGERVQRLYPLRFVPRATTFDEAARAVVEGIPGIGPTTADALLKEFGAIKGVCEAEIQDLRRVAKVGKKKATLIYDLVRHRYGDRRDIE